MLFYQSSADPRIGALMGVTPHQHVTIHLMNSELIGGQVNPSPLQVFTYITEKVGELEGFSQRGGVRCGFLALAHRAEDGQHLQADHFCRAVHVAVQCRAVGVVGGGQVHSHRSEEIVEQLPADPVLVCGVDHRGQSGVAAVGGAVHHPIEKLCRQALQLVFPIGGLQRRIEVVEDVVRASGKAVQGVHSRALLGCEQPGGQKEGASVLRVERAATTIGVAQRGISDTGRMEF